MSMIEGARKLPTHHLTVRVPWHDNGWNGTVCTSPCANMSCTILPRIATGKDDTLEDSRAGESLETMPSNEFPPCVDEHGTIMSSFSVSMIKNHPYAKSSPETHGHFAPTPYLIRPYSAAAIPFHWMLKEQAEGNEKKDIVSRVEALQLGYEIEKEPELGFQTAWVQEGQNQRVLLDTFFNAVETDQSLVFFYAKRTPLSDDHRRVIVGVGRVKTVSDATEYRFEGEKRPKDKIGGYLWERNVEHSIRPNGDDGFLLPYRELLDLAETDESVDVLPCIAFSPNEYFQQYSFGSELLVEDGAIASLLAIEGAIEAMREILNGPWDEWLSWIDKELNRLWQIRGAYPGLGAALNAFGLPHGNLLAWHLLGPGKEAVDPWPLLSNALLNPSSLPEFLRDGIGGTQRQKWEKLPNERRALLKLLARFNLSDAQALRWYQETEREAEVVSLSDGEILENPYRIYEVDRLKMDAIGFDVIDRGMFPPESIRKAFPIPEPSKVGEAIDRRRVRALIIHALEEASDGGHTFLPETWLIQRIRHRPMKPDCPLDRDTLAIVEDFMMPTVTTLNVSTNRRAFQLDRYSETSTLICGKISKRRDGKRNEGSFPWRELVDKALASGSGDRPLSDDDERARQEKAVALEELYKSRVSVLLGGAGTGKSTLLKALCSVEKVENGGILLLAPTGKARVRLEIASGAVGKGKTVAQFLNGLKRYDGSTGRYFINPTAARQSNCKTIIVDECSMLTEEQLAALLDAVKGYDRLILVGDPKQLPPIGAGRPFFDIVTYLTPDNLETLHPRVSKGYAELTVTMRQSGSDGSLRLDVELASLFGRHQTDAAIDEVWDVLSRNTSQRVKLVRWNQPGQLQALLLNELVSKLSLSSNNDEIGFETSLGGVASDFKGKPNIWFANKYKDKPGAAEKAENWQILTPVRQGLSGVLALNRLIQHRFRRTIRDKSINFGYQKTFTAPMGAEEIVYGDKVINVVNDGRRRVYPDKDDKYVANGDIGIVTGHRRTKFRKQSPKILEVEVSSQPGFVYSYGPWEFDGEKSSPPLELAYALSVHKTQGSEFGVTFLVLPNPCRLLSREMLYTALTRQKDKVVVLHQGEFRNFERFSHDGASEILRRMTSLFNVSSPVEVKVKNKSIFLDENLIYLTDRGELVRSKSEWIIADKMNAAGIDYQYEQPVMLDGVERYPDFTVVDDDSGVTWYWEHNGLMSNQEYRERWKRKLAAYEKAGILPLDKGGGPNGTLLITEERKGVGLDAEKIMGNIQVLLKEAT